jgi:hypothetical protein
LDYPALHEARGGRIAWPFLPRAGKNRIRQNLCAALFEHPFFELAGLAGTELSFRISFPDFYSLTSIQRTLHTA